MRTVRRLATAGLALALSALAGAALAAPFCVVTGFGTQCYYYDFPSCQRAASQARGACVAQQEEQPASASRQTLQQSTPKGPPFCVVTGFGSQCYYYDAPSCQQAARASKGACVVNPDR